MYPKTKLTGIFFFGIYFVMALFGDSLLAQSVRNEMLVAMGSSSQRTRMEGLAIQQSIGQSTVTGTFATSSIRVSQGFLRGGIPFSQEIKRPFGVIAFPNAFSENIHFRFTTDHREETLLMLFDERGSLVYESRQVPTANELVLSLPFLASGVYIVHLRSGNKFVQSRIIKKP